jgi:hypothetical protein
MADIWEKIGGHMEKYGQNKIWRTYGNLRRTYGNLKKYEKILKQVCSLNRSAGLEIL